MMSSLFFPLTGTNLIQSDFAFHADSAFGLMEWDADNIRRRSFHLAFDPFAGRLRLLRNSSSAAARASASAVSNCSLSQRTQARESFNSESFVNDTRDMIWRRFSGSSAVFKNHACSS